MQYISYYDSYLGKMLLMADEIGLVGLWFLGQKYYPKLNNCVEFESDIIKQAKNWLDIYFSGKKPDFTPPLHLIGSEFRISIWRILEKIPYGKTVTYNDIAKEIAAKKGINKMSCQAVGGAVGHNKISIIIPCHRVIGTNGNLTGYAGGIDRKEKLLQHEKKFL